MDEYKDIDELCADDDEDDGTITEFESATKHVQTIAANLDETSLLSLYGYYKQAMEGNCNTSRPGWLDFKGKSKWDAWNTFKDISRNQARTLYVNLVKKVDPNYKFTNKTQSWVSVSTLQQQNDQVCGDTNTSILDFVKSGNNEKVRIYFDQNSSKVKDIDKLDEDGMALIHWAADRGSVDVLQLLKERNADLNCLDADKQTPLHYASSCGHLNCVRYLVENGANVDCKDSDGMTPLDMAADEKIKEFFLGLKK